MTSTDNLKCLSPVFYAKVKAEYFYTKLYLKGPNSFLTKLKYRRVFMNYN